MRKDRDWRRAPFPNELDAYPPPQRTVTPLPSGAKVDVIKRFELTDPRYIPRSSIETYLKSAHGLTAFFNYIETMGLPKRIMDIGTGDAIALREMAQEFPDFSFGGTVLTRTPSFNNNPKNLQVITETSAEELTDIEGPVGGILSFQAIAFSNEPNRVVDNMHNILAPGGLIKATFRRQGSYGRDWDKLYDKWGYNRHDPFSQALLGLGYNVGILETEGDDILLAKKPGYSRIFTSSWEDRMLKAKDAVSLLLADNAGYLFREDPIEVFGKETLAQVAGNEATPEDAQAIMTAVTELCRDPEGSNKISITQVGSQRHPIQVVYNPNGIRQFGGSVVDASPFSIQGYAHQRTLRRPAGYLLPAAIKTRDSLFIGTNNKPTVRRTMSYDGNIKWRAGRSDATKLATRQEVAEVLSLINVD